MFRLREVICIGKDYTRVLGKKTQKAKFNREGILVSEDERTYTPGGPIKIHDWVGEWKMFKAVDTEQTYILESPVETLIDYLSSPDCVLQDCIDYALEGFAKELKGATPSTGNIGLHRVARQTIILAVEFPVACVIADVSNVGSDAIEDFIDMMDNYDGNRDTLVATAQEHNWLVTLY